MTSNKKVVVEEEDEAIGGSSSLPPPMSKMSFLNHAFAYVVLGLMTGYYHLFFFVVLPGVVYGLYKSSIFALVFALLLFTATIMPLDHRPKRWFMDASFWAPLRQYFDVTSDVTNIDLAALKKRKHVFFEFPHGVFPMGQVLSASMITPLFGKDVMICGTGADVIFKFPFMRQFFAWLGTRPASRSSFAKILTDGNHPAVTPGGIAEMYLVSDDEEAIFFKKRKGTVKLAISLGTPIIPIFFFGNTKLFTVVGGKGDTGLLASLSRKLRMSVIFFFGRHFLPVPCRYPIKMVACKTVNVEQVDEPSDEQVEEVMRLVEESLLDMYNKSGMKPSWETRPLKIM